MSLSHWPETLSVSAIWVPCLHALRVGQELEYGIFTLMNQNVKCTREYCWFIWICTYSNEFTTQIQKREKKRQKYRQTKRHIYLTLLSRHTKAQWVDSQEDRHQECQIPQDSVDPDEAHAQLKKARKGHEPQVAKAHEDIASVDYRESHDADHWHACIFWGYPFLYLITILIIV